MTGEMRRWVGVLAKLDMPTCDGRLLLPPPEEHPWHRELPLPVYASANLVCAGCAPDRPAARAAGMIDKLWIAGNAVFAQGAIDLAVLDSLPSDYATRLRVPRVVPVAVAVDMRSWGWVLRYATLTDTPAWHGSEIALEPA